MNVRNELERLALWYVPVAVLAAVASTLISGVLQERLASGELTIGSTIGLFQLLPASIGLADNIVVGLWLFGLSRKEGGRSLLWFIFGLVAHLFAAVIYVSMRIYEQRAVVHHGFSSETSAPDNRPNATQESDAALRTKAPPG